MLSIVVAAVGSAYIVDLFLRWGPDDHQVDGLRTSLGGFTLGTVVALVLWEVLAASGVRRTERSDSLIAFFLAAATALGALGAVFNLRWGGLSLVHGTGYGAWLGLALAALILGGGLAHLVEHARASAADSTNRAISGALAVVSGAYLVDLMLPWGPSEGLVNGRLVPHGIDLLPTGLGLSSAVGLFLWELVGVLGIRRTTRSDSLISALLAGAAALIGLIGIVEMRMNGLFEETASLDYGAWIALPLTALLLAGAGVHVLAHVRRSKMAA